MTEREYKLNIDPRILELLGPSLYTNIYYVLAELIANAYDADASNLNVAAVSRNTEAESITPKKRRKMGRKGVGKLAALSVAKNVLIKTIANGEKSGFILSRHINADNLLTPLKDEQIFFEKVFANGTSIIMQEPQYKLHSTLKTIKRNLLKIFPLVNEEFRIHVIQEDKEEVI